MSMKRYLSIGLLGLFLAITGCGTGGGSRSFQSTLRLMDQSGNEKVLFSTTEPVVLELSITNITNAPQTLTAASPQIYEFIVARVGDTQPAWHWSFNQIFPGVNTELSFAAGETKTYQETWDHISDAGSAVSAGNYVAQGYLWTMQEAAVDAVTSETETRSAAVSLSIQ